MKIKDLLLYLPRGVVSNLAKIPRSELNDEVKNKIISEGMYHFVPNEEIADAIIDSEHLRPATGSMKYIDSYGTPVACLFCGAPEVDNFVKNVTSYDTSKNPYINPEMVATAIKVSPTEKEELKNYKIRNLSDNAVLYEGYCVLPHNKISMKKMVPDLVRDENGNPILNKKGEYNLSFREADETEKEFGNQKQDYLKFIQQKSLELGYSNKDSVFGRANNYINNLTDQYRMESDITKRNMGENVKDFAKRILKKIKSFISNIGTKKLEAPVETEIDKFEFKKKNPFQDKKFGKFVAEIQSKEGLEQIKLKESLQKLKESRVGNYLADKYDKLEYNSKDSGIHGRGHSDRVILNSMIIAQREGFLKYDDTDRLKDILITAAAYHNIGRISNVGPHSARSARKIRKMDLKFNNGKQYSSEDKAILMAVVEGHEGEPEKIDKLLNKYKITNEADKNLARTLSTVLRDADALDRVRLDIVTPTNTKVNLDPKYLKTNSAKTMLTSSYELESLTSKNSMSKILGYLRTKELNDFDKQYKVEGADKGILDVSQRIKTDKDTGEKIDIMKEDDGITL